MGLSAVAVAQPAVAVAERGDLALVPYYTVVRGEWVTGIHIVNTSEHTQVVKFRFRRATDGMDALDFNIVMSPRDVYAGRLFKDENGNIAWASTDSTCTVPATQGNRLTMPSIYDEDAESGYVEIIAMGQAETELQPIALAAKHVKQNDNTFKPLDCAAVRSNFFADGVARVVNAATGAITVAGRRGVVANNRTFQPGVTSSNPTLRSGGNTTYVDSGNVLKVSYFIRDNATGIEFGDNAVHIANFLDRPSITNQQYGIASGDLNGFDFPDLGGTGLPNGAALSTIQRGRFNLLRRADVLGAKRIINEWSVNPANGVEMDWVVTLPGQYLMLRLPQYLASLGADRAWFPTVSSAGSPLENPQCPYTARGTGPSRVEACDFRDQPLELEYVAYNREEFQGEADTGTLVVSPQPPTASATTYLPNVANVITFGGNGVLGQSDANVNANLGQPFGWLEAKLRPRSGNTPRVCAWSSTQDGVSAPARPLSATAGRALTMDCTVARAATGEVPVIGFAAWSRQVAANPDASYGRIVEHSYGTAPGAPSGLALAAGNAQVVASWRPAPGATSYTLYYSQQPISNLNAPGVMKVENLSSNWHIVTGLTNGIQYYAVVTATTAGGESAPSNAASATPQVSVPSMPTGLSATAGDSQITVNWTAVPGATSYTIYYAPSPVSFFIASGVIDLAAAGVMKVENLSGASHTVTGLTNGRRYYVRVVATNAGGGSPASNEASATPQVPAPGAPSGLSVTAGAAQLAASWTAPPGGAMGYNLYYSQSPISDLTAAGVVKVANLSGTSHTVTMLPSGTQYYVVVTAINAGGESAASNEASATPTGSATNAAPRAAISAPSSANERTSAPISATGSSDTDGSVAAYQWSLNNPDPDKVNVSIENPMQANAILAFGEVQTAADITLNLQVTDNAGATASTQTTVRVAEIDAAGLPPRPDVTASLQTVPGIDTNGNGVRDDMEHDLYEFYPLDTPRRKVLLVGAQAMQMQVLVGMQLLAGSANNPSAGEAASQRTAEFIACALGNMGGIDSIDADFLALQQDIALLKLFTLNTAARDRAYIAYQESRGGTVQDSIDPDSANCSL